jgi:hypothetical protein
MPAADAPHRAFDQTRATFALGRCAMSAAVSISGTHITSKSNHIEGAVPRSEATRDLLRKSTTNSDLSFRAKGREATRSRGFTIQRTLLSNDGTTGVSPVVHGANSIGTRTTGGTPGLSRVKQNQNRMGFPDRDLAPELSLYRSRTLALLQRYLQLSAAVGRLPSLVGRECFRARVTSYRVHTFEDSVIFVLDTERALAELHHSEQQVVARVVFQGHSHDAAARLIGCTRTTLTRSLCAALDRLTEVMLERRLLRLM